MKKIKKNHRYTDNVATQKSIETKPKSQREFIEDLRKEWKEMWVSRFDDKTKAEGVADRDYQQLFVERGLVILATRDYKSPDFQEIVEKYLTPEEIERFSPSPTRGGIHKFIRTYITPKNEARTNRSEQVREDLKRMKQHPQLKHGGRGWLHINFSYKR